MEWFRRSERKRLRRENYGVKVYFILAERSGLKRIRAECGAAVLS